MIRDTIGTGPEIMRRRTKDAEIKSAKKYFGALGVNDSTVATSAISRA